MMDIEKEREAFEVALNIDEYIDRSEVAFSVENGCYELTAPEDVAGNISISKLYKLNSMFKAWQAAKTQAIPNGYKLVPVEPSKSCLENLGDVIFDNFGTTATEVDRCAEEAYKAMIGAVE